jgi:bacterial leucyl aminopeptidase
MSQVRRLGFALTVVLLSTVPALAATARLADDVWITIERGAAQHAMAGLAAAGHPGALVVMDAASSDALSVRAKDTDIVVAHVTPAAFDLLPEIVHGFVSGHGPRFVWHPDREEAEGAASRANTQLLLRIPDPPIPYTIDNGPVAQALMAPMQEGNVRTTITSLGSFFTRRHTCPSGLASATWIRDLWQSLAAGRPDVTVEYYAHVQTQQPSIILTIPGAALPSEIVVLGGHQDSTAGSNCTLSRSPGEDDDASGIANLTEVIRVAMALNYRPLRTVQFMAYAGEEGGLLGSEEIALAYRQQNKNVVGVLQLDMTNYKGSAGDIYIFTDFTNPEQNAFVGNLVDTYLSGLVRGTSQCGYGCSDHAAWTDRGYPASLPFEATFNQSNPFIHSSQDTIAQSGNNANHALKFSKLAAAYMAEVAKGCGFTANQTPIANAGLDHQTSPLVTLLDGRASADPDNWPGQTRYSWTQVSGPRVTILDAQSPLARFRAPYLRATYVFRLTVSDGCVTVTDDVTVFPRTEP